LEDLTGKKLGPYEIISPLGEGGMAMVYRGYQPGVSREVAIKVLPPHVASDERFAARFQREAQLLAQLQHPHILPVFDYGSADGYTYLAMPLIRSGTLAHWLNGQPLARHQCHKFVAQIGGALDYAHARGLIHRDVKPSNVLIDERGNCLLSDFGLARMVEGGEPLTVSGAVMGTPAYMSPEQCMGRPLDGRSDVYSLGIMLYEMAVGRAPYEADPPILIVVKHIHDPLPAPGAIVPGFPPGLEAVILKSLAKKPEDRYQTAGALVEALSAAVEAIDTGAARAAAHTPPARQAGSG
jgi:serine/threonine protein kinase